LTIGSGVTLTNVSVGALIGDETNYRNVSVVNQGNILASGATMTVNGTAVRNEGTLQASGGGQMYATNLTNAGL